MGTIITQIVRDASGHWWTYLSGFPGKTALIATKRGVWSSGWDMPESTAWSQTSLEPLEGFGD
jgi:hypothetical protein